MKFHARGSRLEAASERPREDGARPDRRSRLLRVAEFIASGGYSLLRPEPAQPAAPMDAHRAGYRLADVVATGGYALVGTSRVGPLVDPD